MMLSSPLYDWIAAVPSSKSLISNVPFSTGVSGKVLKRYSTIFSLFPRFAAAMNFLLHFSIFG